MLDSKVLENANGDKYTLTEVGKNLLEDKKANALFWDETEDAVEALLIERAEKRGVNILEIGDPHYVKELAALLIYTLEKNYKEVSIPVIDRDL
ncbi:hypothetical protein P4679_22520 [Priestia megaterium]|uniref:hypothetical protein n=1 Tax=Priestia megaterium TaxID=1404 RepID=UPI002E243F82|nr:hypothetical protein [Priestia megaterium]